jgi:putative transposase
VIAHSDAGSQYTSVAHTERLAEIHAFASIGSIGDSYDCEHDGVAVRPGLTPVYE